MGGLIREVPNKEKLVTSKIYIYILNYWQIPIEFEKQYLSFNHDSEFP